MPLAWAIRYIAGDSMPKWPWADVGIIEPKAGDVMVHLAGILAFWTAGLDQGKRQKEKGKSEFRLSFLHFPFSLRLVLLAVCAGVIGSYERAGMLAFLAAFLLCVILRPHHGHLHKLMAVVVIGLLVLAISNVRLQAPSPGTTKVREISFQQIVDNLVSVTGSSQLGDLDDTKEWRLQWWGDIFNYTFRGPYFWQGKGFGINLADDDGFQVWKDGSLRSPHNASLVFLARAGVPGLVLWLAVQCGWAGTIFRAYLGAQRSKRQRWAGLFLFLLAYWLAFMVNASFDVFMEGPMGGIWFWCIFGLGLAAIWIYRRDPEMLRDK
jgi:O-antigen ligase